jgi:flagellar biosynthesis chaperone FliJ
VTNKASPKKSRSPSPKKNYQELYYRLQNKMDLERRVNDSIITQLQDEAAHYQTLMQARDIELEESRQSYIENRQSEVAFIKSLQDKLDAKEDARRALERKLDDEVRALKVDIFEL